jgi:hypothetical protein
MSRLRRRTRFAWFVVFLPLLIATAVSPSCGCSEARDAYADQVNTLFASWEPILQATAPRQFPSAADAGNYFRVRGRDYARMLTDWRAIEPPNNSREFHTAVAASLDGARAFNAKIALGYETDNQSLIAEALADARSLSERSTPEALFAKFRTSSRC